MLSLKKKRRIQLLIILGAFLFIATALIGYAMKDGIQYFRSPSQIVLNPPSSNERFRLGGLVKENSWVKGDKHEFLVTDNSKDIKVTYKGILPDLFREGQGVIATGYLKDGLFEAIEILAKHDENYIPKEVMETLKDQGLYKPSN